MPERFEAANDLLSVLPTPSLHLYHDAHISNGDVSKRTTMDSLQHVAPHVSDGARQASQ